MIKLGKLTRHANVRDVWGSEASDFTPWLAKEENLSLLSEEIGLGTDGLEFIRIEQAVGNFIADIFCKETVPDGRNVIIENQFGSSNHDHLDKLLTYVAGEKANILVWVCESLREEHKAAIDLLNSISGDEFEVFGIELELRKIGQNVNLSAHFNTRDSMIAVTLYLLGEPAKAYFSKLSEVKNKIEEKLGYSLDWRELPEKQDARITLEKAAVPEERQSWPEQHEWLSSRSIEFYHAFKPYVASLHRGLINEYSGLEA